MRIPTPEALWTLYAAEAERPIRAALAAAGPGHCLRVTSLPESVMATLATALHGEGHLVRVLVSQRPDAPWKATATKVVELRNTASCPFLLFVPPTLRTAAEDSFDVNTFQEVSLADTIATGVAEGLVARLESVFGGALRDALAWMRRSRVIRTDDDAVLYLLTILENGSTRAAGGGALFTLGLLPDYSVFEGDVPFSLSRNAKIRDILTDIRQPLQSRISRLPITPQSIQADLFRFLRDRQSRTARSWAEEVACSAEWAHLSLDRWPFADAPSREQLRLLLEQLVLPHQRADEVGGTVAMPVLDLDGTTGLKFSIRSIPPPADIQAWKTYRVQVLSLDEEEPSVAWESNSFKKPPRSARTSRTLRPSSLSSLEEGTYYLRVDGYDQDGALLTGSAPKASADERAENESEPFLVVRRGAEIAPEAPRSVRVPSFTAAFVDAGVKALSGKSPGEVPDRTKITGDWNEPVGAAVRGDVHYALEGVGVAGYSVAVPAILRKVELTILEHPAECSALRIDLTRAASPADLEVTRSPGARLPSGESVDRFVACRALLFGTLLSQHHTRFDADRQGSVKPAGIVETTDLMAVSSLVEAYAQAYVELVEHQLAHSGGDAVEAFRALAMLDSLELRWPSSPGDPGRGILLGPTHPLRLLWQLQHAAVCGRAIQAWAGKSEQVDSWRGFLAQLRDEIVQVNLPMVVFDRQGRSYVEYGPLTTHWSLYLPDHSESRGPVDTAACRDAVKRYLDIRRPAAAPVSIGSRDLAQRLFDYLQQHPYVEQIRLNVFNPGDGQLVADTLRELERMRRHGSADEDAPPLRYAVQMFSTSPVAMDVMGDALESLLDPDRQVAEDDEFTLSSSNHLFPKLVFARNRVDDFVRAPARFRAHVAVVLEHFGASGRLARIGALRRGSFVEGLVLEPETQLATQDGRYGWHKGLRPDTSVAPDTREQLLCEGLAATQRLQAAAASGQPADRDVAPVVALQLDPEAQGLLKLIHDHADWVFTIDRHLGLDYFDSPASPEQSGYLLDFAPEYLHEDRQRIMLTTRHVREVSDVVRPALEQFGLEFPEGGELVVLETLRSLSGRLALRALSSENRTKEMVGLLLTRWLLEGLGLLGDRIVIPLDAHRGWFDADPEDPDSSSRRADLAIVGFSPESRLVSVRIVEVKLRDDLPDAARAALYRDMQDQADNTVDRLRQRFDLDLYPGLPRADRLVRAKELATSLAFYTRRAQRYGLMGDLAADQVLDFIQTLDSGYRLDVDTLGVVFVRTGRGAHLDDEGGFIVHRFGLNVAQRLLSEATVSTTTSRSSTTGDAGSARRPPSVGDSARDPELQVFRTSAAPPSRVTTRERATTVEPVAPIAPFVSENVQVDQDHPPARPGAPIPFSVLGDRTQQPDPGAFQPESVSTRVEDVASTGGVTREAEFATGPTELARVADRGRPWPSGAPTLLGATEHTPQFGIIGRLGDTQVALDLNGCNTISLFGVQGFGKSYSLGVIAEMATTPVAGINELPQPLATVIFHYHKSDAYPPEYATANSPNCKAREVERLLSEYRAAPHAVGDILLLAPEAKVEERRREFPTTEVQPIKFASGELGAESWKFLLGAYGNDSLYVRQLVAIMRRHRSGLTLEKFRREIEEAELPQGSQRLAEDRLKLAEPYIDDSACLRDLLRPGRTVIVDLRDEWIEKDEALGLFVVMLKIFATAKHHGSSFNKLVVFDEAHKYISESDLIGQVVETIREMRHQATSVVIASQDPLSVPRAVIELTSVLLLHRMTSPQWLKHLKTAISALDDLTEAHLAALQAGEALVWAQRSTDRRFTLRPQKVTIRPRFSQHGGGTKTAVSGETVR